MRSYVLVFVLTAFAAFLVSCSGEKSEASADMLLRRSVDAALSGDWPVAGKYASTALENTSADSSAFILEGLALESEGKDELAVGRLEEAVKLDPDSFMANYSLGRILFRKSDYRECLPYLQKACKIKKGSPDATALLAEAYFKLKMPIAKKYYAVALKTRRFKSTPAPWNQLGIVFSRENKKKKALECFVRAYKLEPSNPVTVFNIATLLDYRMKKGLKAVPFYKRYLQLIKHNSALSARRERVGKRIKQLSGG
jgi:tetratricopeptide (TPR) repeat protein